MRAEKIAVIPIGGAQAISRFLHRYGMDASQVSAVVLVEGVSDRSALEALAVRRGRDRNLASQPEGGTRAPIAE